MRYINDVGWWWWWMLMIDDDGWWWMIGSLVMSFFWVLGRLLGILGIGFLCLLSLILQYIFNNSICIFIKEIKAPPPSWGLAKSVLPVFRNGGGEGEKYLRQPQHVWGRCFCVTAIKAPLHQNRCALSSGGGGGKTKTHEKL